MSQSGPMYVEKGGGIAQLFSLYTFINSTVMQAPYALAVGGPNGNVLYVTNNAQDSNGKFYISTYNAGNGALLVPYFIEIATGGLDGLALSKDNTILYVSVFSGSAPGVYTYNATSGRQPINPLTRQPSNGPFVRVKEPRGIAIEGNTLYVASYQDSMIYEFDATTGVPLNDSIKVNAPTNITVEPAAALGP